MDWTFDFFMEDARAYHETPCKGIYPDSSDYRRYFMVSFKNMARDFKAKWLETHAHLYDRYDGYIGDAFARTLFDGWFSDFYKDAYGQRPHLPIWFYVQAVGFPQRDDTARTFCASPVEDAIADAQAMRAAFEREEAMA